VISSLRLNLTLPGLDPVELSRRYQAAVEMAELADRAGFGAIQTEEHHGADDGWMPVPLLFSGMVAARTQRSIIAIQALLFPLHDPLRVAEDLIVLDLVSAGRMHVVLGLGYRPSEYLAHGKDWDRRGQIMDECVADLVRAWRGEPIERDGKTVRVTPRPLTPNPPVMIGGSGRPAARRAARFGLPLSPPAKMPELEAYYEQLCAENGTVPVVVSPPEHVSLLFVSEDPDRAWKDLGGYLLHEAVTYASWQTPDIRSSVHSHATNTEGLREEGIYEILSPAECRARVAEQGPNTLFALHPLCGGMPLEPAWECVHLFLDEVVAKI
jgi:alkanesulfonate monooxygenase SsuD/methylene tetrahydromethanopterin reductase-like flavin-dependent oxidoreductase (luciferase family)